MKFSSLIVISSALSFGLIGCAGSDELDTRGLVVQPTTTTPTATTPAATTPAATTPAATTPAATTPVATTPVPTTPIATTPIPTTPPAGGACSGACWSGCFECAIGGETNETAPCKPQGDSCWDDPACGAYTACKDPCLTPEYDEACVANCDATHAAGKAKWDAILTCSEQNGCTGCF